MQIGLTKRIMKRKTGKRVPFNVPQLVNSSRTIFFGTYHPKKRQVRKEPTGISNCAVRLSHHPKKSLPQMTNSGTAPCDNEQKIPMIQQMTVSTQAPFLRLIFFSS